ncbi:MAG: ATP-binding cassette domain-containing protein [bacterium]|nr:ATP-binding cassette domain-containing protein [bacterium]
MISVNKLTKIYRTPFKTGNVVKDLFARSYKEHVALKDVSFEIGENELVGFIGPNGAGKTTTMKVLAGILYPTSGDIQVLGATPFDKRPEFLKQISFIMGQKNQTFWELPATDAFEFNKAVYEIGDEEYKRTVGDLVDLLDATDIIKMPVKTLSLGQRMRVELIAALIHTPKVLFLDEPTIGLDIVAQSAIVKFIKEYQEKYKSTIMLTSHYMQDVERLAKRIIVIDQGHILYDGKLDELVAQYSNVKKIYVTLLSPLPHDFHLHDGVNFRYEFPRVEIDSPRSHLSEVLSHITKRLEFSDISVEDEPIEEIIKRVFTARKG